MLFCSRLVLPLTREWIEIYARQCRVPLYRFSLLRGSGLKSFEGVKAFIILGVLPLTREWIEMGMLDLAKKAIGSPSYEGVD